MKKYSAYLLSFLYCVFTIISLSLDFSFGKLFSRVLLILPLIILITLNKDAYALLISCLFFTFEFISNFLFLIASRFSDVIQSLSFIFALIYFLALLQAAIKIIKNKYIGKKYIYCIIGILYFGFFITVETIYIINNFALAELFNILSTIVLYLLLFLYIYLIPKKDIKIFA